MEGPELGGEQQFCLRWNNFQANITSQFEALRDDEDFVDVTLACEGHRLEAHKVVLSACSPYFKELFKSNPCPHPIIFMRDCELIHITALLEFMYAGEVNISQAQLTSFLRTAEALQIRGLTDSSDKNKTETKNTSKSNPSQLRSLLCGRLRQQTSPAKDTSQNAGSNDIFLKTVKHFSQSRRGARAECETPSTVQSHNGISEKGYYPTCLPGSSNNCELKDDALRLKENILANNQNDENYAYNLSESNASLLNENENLGTGKINPFAVGNVNFASLHTEFPHEMIEPKLEVPDYTSDDDTRQDRVFNPDLLFGVENAQMSNPFLALQGDAAASTSQDIKGEIDAVGRAGGPGRVSCAECGRRYSNLSNLRQHVRLIHRSQPVACPLCARSFKTPLYLRRHTLSQHSDTLPRNRTPLLLDKTDSINDRALLTPLTDRISSIGERSSAVSNKGTSCGSRSVAYANRPRTVSTATLVGLPQLRKMNRLPVMTIDGTNSENSVLKCINGKTKVFESVNGDASSDSAEDDIIKMEDEEVITDDL